MQRFSMENDRDLRILTPKFTSFDGVVSPIHAMNFSGSRRFSSKFDPYASDSSDSPSPLMKYLRCADTGAGAVSPTAFITPVKVEEDVIVMDGIPVPKSKKGSGELRMRSPLMPSNSANSSLGRSTSTGSPASGSGGRGSGNESSKLYKNRLCRFWETGGICQFGTECQFAHGKEELRPHRSSSKIKPEIFKLNNSLEGSSSPYGFKSPQFSRVKAKAAAAAEEAFSLSSIPAEMGFRTSLSPIPFKQPSESPISSGPIPNTTLPKSDWTPMDDGIEVALPSDSAEGKTPSKEDVDVYIEKVLYGTNARKRLPVFVDICPDC